MSTGPAAADKKKKSGAEPLIARWLGRTLDVALWTGGFKGGFFVVLIMILALLGMLCVPATYLWGRKRGRW
jgi:asparagine N-glycosylation enzyme membrane subunit Stt3